MVQIEGLENWVSPQREFVQSQLAATIADARTAALLALVLPVDAASAPSTVRRHALGVGQRLDDKLRSPIEAVAFVPGAFIRIRALLFALS